MKLVLRIGRYLWFIIVGLLVVIAIAVSVLHLMVPDLNQHRSYFEKTISQALGEPVSLGRIQARWSGIVPQIDFYDVTIYQRKLSNESPRVLLKVKDLHASLNFWTAFLSMNLRPTAIILNGVDVNVALLPNNKININGIDFNLKPQQKGSLPNTGTSAIQFLETQSHLAANNLNLYLTQQNGQHALFDIYHLDIFNYGNMHRVLSSLRVKQQKPTDIDFAAKIIGSFNKPDQLKVESYARAKNLELTQWLHYPVRGYLVENGVVDGEAWVDWSHGYFQTSQLRISAHDLQIKSLKKNKQLPLRLFQGKLAWQPLNNGWAVQGKEIKMQIGQKFWPASTFSVQETDDATKQLKGESLKISYLDLDSLHALISNLDVLPKKWDDLIDHLQMSGELHNLNASTQGKALWQQYSASVNITDVAMLPWQNIPGVVGLNGQLKFNQAGGEFISNSQDLLLDLPKLFKHPLSAGEFHGNISWQKQADAWLVNGVNITTVNQDAALAGSFALLLPDDKQRSPLISALFGFYEQNPAVIKQYLPENFLHHNLSEWLNQAFIAGKPSEGTFVLRGHLHDFPFNEKHQGAFIVNATVNDLQFQYAPGWPMLTGVSGSLLFKNNMMLATADGGHIYQTQIKSVIARIPKIKTPDPTVLLIDSKVQSTATDIGRFLNESPLKKKLGNDFQNIEMQGPVAVNLGLQIPLDDLEKTKVNGQTFFDNVNVTLPAWNLSFNQLNGEFDFSENSVSAKELKAVFFGYPAIASFSTIKQGPWSTIRLDLASQLSVDQLNHYLHLPGFVLLQGKTHYKARVDFHTDPKDSRQNKLSMSSDLQGISTTWPAPFGKTKAEKRFSTLTMAFGENKPTKIHMNYGKQLSAAVLLKSQGKSQSLYSADFYLGGTGATIQQLPGLTVSGSLDNFKLTDWLPQFAKIQQKIHQPGENALQLRMVDLNFAQAEFYGQTLTNTSVKIIPEASAYDISFDGPQVVGGILLPNDLQKGVVSGHFQQLYLDADGEFAELEARPGVQQSAAQGASNLFNPENLPRLNLSVGDLRINDKEFRSLTLQGEPGKNAYLVDKLNFNSPLLETDIKGAWTLQNHAYHTSLQGYASTEDLQQLLQAWKLESSLVGTTANIRFNLDWLGAPYQFTAAKLNGQATLNLGSGYIPVSAATENKLAIAKILSLLSIQQLFTGFGSLHHKGYTFSTAHAELKFTNGLMNISNAYFDGSVAKLAFSGDVNLVLELLDLNLVVTPHVTSSLPIVAGVVTLNPIVGVAAWVADKLFSPAVNAFTKSTYSVVGPWSKPVVKKVTSIAVTQSQSQSQYQNHQTFDRFGRLG